MTSLLLAFAAASAGFVAIPEGRLAGHRIDAFEMAAHPVTNAEYKAFVDATGAQPPLHWQGGRIPAGMEQHPVVFVNRYEAAAYASWLSRKEGRPYRLPTAAEFEYGAQGTDISQANYDAKGDHTFAQWREYLKPVKSSPANP